MPHFLDVSDVLSSEAAPDGSGFAIGVKDAAGNCVAIRVPLRLAGGFLIAVMDSASDAELLASRPSQSLIAEGWLLQPSDLPGMEVLSIRMEGGAHLHLQVPKGSGTSSRTGSA